MIAAMWTQEVPKVHPIVGLRTEMPGIALPPPILLDLPVLGGKKKTKYAQVDRHQQQSLATRNRPSTAANHNTSITLSKQQTSSYENNLPLELSDPQNIVQRAAQFYHAGDHGTMIKILEVLDRHLVLSEDIEMAREFGQGLAHYSKYQYRIAKTFFESLLELSVKHQSAGNHSLASIYLGEVELYWGNNEEAVKHFTVAADKYHADSVAEVFQMTVLSKSTVLVRKGSCHRALSQIKEAISAFKTERTGRVTAVQQDWRITEGS